MESLSSRSLARVLSDIAVLLSSGDRFESRLQRVVALVGELVPYSDCVLHTTRPREVRLASPENSTRAGLLHETATSLLADLRADGSPVSRWPQWESHLAVPLVDPDVHVIGLLLLARHAGPFSDLDLRVLSIVSGHLSAYLTWLQYREERAAALARERECRQAAEMANHAKDSFLATLSHELRSPLNAIVGWSDMLMRGTLPADTVQRGLEAIHRNARAQTNLIEDVLDVSRIIAGKFQLDKQPLDLTVVLSAAIEAIRPSADARGLRVTADLPACPTPLHGDANRLQQAFSNLLSNAVKFTPAGGGVTVSLSMADDHVRVEVTDTGIGIARQALPHVFDRFFQQDSSITRRQTGLGLGLAIVKHIVEEHGGAVEVRSEGEGRGAQFAVTLPVEPAAESQETPQATEVAGTASQGLQDLEVLVVDDEQETRELMTTLLAGQGANVTAAASADEGLAAAVASAPALVIADLAMPAKDGLTFIREVRERGLRMPAIALTAHGRPEDRAFALDAGFDLYLTKPVLPPDLIAAIRRIVRQPL